MKKILLLSIITSWTVAHADPNAQQLTNCINQVLANKENNGDLKSNQNVSQANAVVNKSTKSNQKITAAFLINQITNFHNSFIQNISNVNNNQLPQKKIKAINLILQIVNLLYKLEISAIQDIRDDRLVIGKQLLTHLKLTNIFISEIRDILKIDTKRFANWINSIIGNAENWLSYQ